MTGLRDRRFHSRVLRGSPDSQRHFHSSGRRLSAVSGSTQSCDEFVRRKCFPIVRSRRNVKGWALFIAFAAIVFTPPTLAQTLSRPHDVNATALSPTTIELTWRAPFVDSGVPPITGYKIEYSVDGNEPWNELEADTGSTTTSYTDTVEPLTTRHYRIYAINSSGTGNVSSTFDTDHIATTPGTDLCTRSFKVQTKIFNVVKAADSSVTACELVTATHLANITSLNLRSLELDNTDIVAGDFAGLTGLTSLNIEFNNFTSVPAEVRTLTTLTSLDLSLNPSPDLFSEDEASNFTLTADSFAGLTALTHLDLNAVRLNSLPATVFAGLTNLQWLDLTATNRESLPTNVFVNNTKLEHLDLTGNDLGTLNADVFSGLTALKHFNLSDNPFTSFPDGLFSGLTALELVDSSKRDGSIKIPVPVTITKTSAGKFKAGAVTGTPFSVGLHLDVANGGVTEGSRVEFPVGTTVSPEVTVTRTHGAAGAVTVDIKRFSSLPTGHVGYEFQKSGTFPLEVMPALPEISVTAQKDLLVEGTDSQVVFTLTRTGSTASALNVQWSREDEGDFLAVNTGLTPTTATFAAGNSTTTVTLALDDDSVAEFEGGNVTLTIEVPDPATYGFSPTAGSATVRILDDESKMQVRWELTAVTAAEDDGTVSLTVVAETPNMGQPIAISGVTAATRSVTATASADFATLAKTLSFAEADFAVEHGRNIARKSIAVEVSDDTRHEGYETFEVALLGGTGLTTGVTGFERAEAVATVTISDDDDAPVLALSVTPDRVTEGTTAAVQISTTNGTTFDSDQTIALAAAGTATADDDFTLAPASLTLNAGASASDSAVLTVVDDAVDENDESVVITATHSGVTIGERTVVLVDDDGSANQPATGKPTISGTLRVGQTLSASVSDITDADGLSGVTYNYQWLRVYDTNETEINGATANTYTLTTTDAGRSIRVRVSFSDQEMNTEVRLSDPTATVADMPEISIAPLRSTIIEGSGDAAVFTLTRTGSTATDLTVTLSVAGEKSSMISGTAPSSATFAIGSTTTEISVAITDDESRELFNLSVTATITEGDGYTVHPSLGSAVVWVLDDDRPMIAFYEYDAYEIQEDGEALTATVFIVGTGETAPSIAVFVAQTNTREDGARVLDDPEVPGGTQDFSSSGTLVAVLTADDFTEDENGDWVASRGITVTPIDDNLIEGNEFLDVQIHDTQLNKILPQSSSIPAQANVPVTIVDDDFPNWDFSITPDSVTEGGSATVSISILNDVRFINERTVNLKFGGSAVESEDFTVDSSALTLAATSRASVSATLTITDDAAVEGEETIMITAVLDDGTVIGQRSLTIDDDDDTSMQRTVSIMPSTGGDSVAEGSNAEFTVTLDQAPASELTVSVSVTEEGGTIANPEDYTAPQSVNFSSTDTEKTLSVATRDRSNAPELTAFPGAVGRITAVLQPGTAYAIDSSRASASVTVRDSADGSNSAPVFSSAATFSVNESETTVGTVVADDSDAEDAVSYAITGGADMGRFAIGETSGVLSFKIAPDFENPTDVESTTPVSAASNNEYVLTVTATGGADARALTTDQVITVTVVDVAEPDAPSGFTATARNLEIQLAWTAPAADADITHHEYRVRTEATWPDNWIAVQNSAPGEANEDGYTVGGLPNGTAHTFQLRAVNNAGPGPVASNTPSATPTALANSSLDAETPSTPTARGSAVYDISFTGTWTSTVTPDSVPMNAHFSPLIGAVHDTGAVFLTDGGTASAGVESMAESGATATFVTEVTAAGSNALSSINPGGNIGATATKTVTGVKLTSEHPLVTLLTMIAPSPDWFVGIAGLSLLDASGEWVTSRTVNLYPWDAGTEEGTGFSLNNAATSPQGVITNIRNSGPFSNAKIATLSFARQSVNEAPVITTAAAISVAENQTAVATLTSTDAENNTVTWSKNGGADADSFELTSAGVLTFSNAPDFEIPSDADTSNDYEVVVRASDGTDSTDLELTVTVSDVDPEVSPTDATLASLVVSDGMDAVPVTPVFTSETTSYAAIVEFDVPTVTITASQNVDAATLSYLDESDTVLEDASADEGFQVALDVGENVVQVKVTATDTVTTKTYTLTLTRESSDPIWTATMTIGQRLHDEGSERGFEASNSIGMLDDTEFDWGDPSVTYTVVRLSADVDDFGFHVQADAPLPAGLILEVAEVTLVLRSSDEGSYEFSWGPELHHNAPSLHFEAQYRVALPLGGTGTVCLRKASQICPDTAITPPAVSTDASLNELVVTGGDDSEEFDVVLIRPGYPLAASVANSVTTVTVKAVTTSPQASIEWFDDTDTALSDADTVTDDFQVPVSVGDNVIKMKVTAGDAVTVETFTLTVTRKASKDATLSNLVLNDGTSDLTLHPVFATETLSYTASVANSITQVTVTPTTTHDGATVTYFDASDNALSDADGDDETGFQASLSVGSNAIKAKVTAQDTTTTKTYTVVVTRAAGPPDAPENLSGTPHSKHVNLSWDAPSDNGGSAVTKYQICVKASGSCATSDWSDIPNSGSGQANEDSYTVTQDSSSTALANDTAYTFYVRAVNATGSGDSADVTETPTAVTPTLPSGHTQLLTATLTVADLGSGTLGCDNSQNGKECSTTTVLSEDAFAYDGGKDVDELTFTTDGAHVFIGFSPAFSPLVHSEIRNGFTLHVGSESLAASSGTLLPTGQGMSWTGTDVSWIAGGEVHVLLETSARVPDAPTNLSTTAGFTKVTLGWTQGSDNDSTLILHEYCQKTASGQTCGDSDWTAIANSGAGETNEASYTVTSLNNGTEYFFRVRAVNTLGPGAASGEERATPEAPAQTTLVSNTGKVTTGNRIVNSSFTQAQGFTTGNNDGGYTLTTIDVNIHQVASNTNPKVSIYSATSAGAPDSSLYVLTDPSNFSAGIKTFTAPANASLDKETEYVLVFQKTSGSYQLKYTPADSEDAGAANGWSIADDLYWKSGNGAWSTTANSFMIAVKGFAGTSTFSSDATLSALVLNDGTSDLTLSPVFATGTRSYTASVMNSITQMTVTPTTTHDSATVAYFDASNAELTDVDEDPMNGFQTSLDVGTNTIKVKVTAQNSTTTQTYSVVVTRAASMDASLSSLVVNDGTNDLTLSPVFATATLSYTASVANSITQVTVTPTTTHDGAKVAYFDASDTELTDDDAMNGFQADLDVGPNTINVKVTAQDANTTQTYSITLTRTAGAPDAPENLNATAHSKHVNLTWDEPSNNGGSTVTKYQLCVKTSGTCASTEWSDIPNSGANEANEDSYTVTQDSSGTALANDTAYTFYVRAVNAIGSGDAADVTETPTAVTPTLPEGHTQLLTATLTVQDTGSGTLGCNNTESGKECSTTTVLTNDDFTYNGSRAVTDLRVSNNTLVFAIAPAFAASLETEVTNGFTLHLGSVSTSPSWGVVVDNVQHMGAHLSDLSWVVGSEVHVLMETSATVPDAPTNLTTTAGDTQVSLGWTIGDDNDSAITKHQVCQKSNGTDTCAESDWSDIPMSGAGGDNEQSYTVTGLTNGAEVFFRIRAVNALGPGDSVGPESETPASNVATLSALVLNDGTNDLTLNPVFTTATLSYTAAVVNAVTRIKVAPTTSNADATVAYLDASDNALTDADGDAATGFQVDLDVGTNTINVKITAQDTVTTQTYAVVVTRAARAPDAPENLSASAHSKHVNLTWDAPTDNGGSAVTEYQICVKSSGTCASTDWSDIPNSGGNEANEDSYTVTQDSSSTALANDTAYTFYLRAVNAIGSGDAADVTATPTAVTPTLPTGHTQLFRATLMVADLGSGTLGCDNTESGKECSTTTVLSEDTFTYNGSKDMNELSFTVDGGHVAVGFLPAFSALVHNEIRNGFTLHLGNESLKVSSGVLLPTGAGVTWVGTDVSWIAGSTVHVLLETSATAPDAPSNLTTRASDTKVTLGWSQGDDNDSALIRHEYCQNESASQTCGDSDWTTIPTSGAGETNEASYVVTGLTNNTEYFFRVRAVNALGPGTASSEESETPDDGMPTLPAGHKELLAATLTVQDLGSNQLGCHNNISGKECSTTTVLSKDDFAYGGTKELTALFLPGASTVRLGFSPSFANTLHDEVESGFALQLGGLSLTSGSVPTSGSLMNFAASEVSWTEGDTVHVMLSTSAGVPDAPTDLTTVAGDTKVTLGWTKGNDNGSALTKHQVCQKTNGTDICTESDWTDIPMSGAGEDNEQSYIVTGLTNGSETFFYVRSVNTLGPGGSVGPESETPVSSVATLSNLVLNDGTNNLTLNPTFVTATLSYAASVANSIDQVTVTPTTTNDDATVAFLDASDTELTDADGDDETGFQAAVSVGTNTIKVKVTAQDSSTTHTYTVVVTRAASSSASLSALVLNDGTTDLTLSPVFATATLSYATSVANTIAQVTVSPTTTNVGAEVTFLDDSDTALPDADGDDETGFQVALSVGSNTIKVKVTAQDTVTTQTYIVTVSRAASTDASLSALVINDGTTDLTLNPVFATATLSYATSVANTIAQVTVTPTTTNDGAEVTYLDDSDTALPDADGDDETGFQVALSVGSNTIKVKVTAQDANTTQTYSVVVTRSARAPDAPENLSATAYSKHVKLTWDAPTDNGGSAVTEYQICVKTSGTCASSDWSDIPNSGSGEANENSYTATEDSSGTALVNDTAYTFYLRAVNAIGGGGAADVTATPTAVIPTLPEGHTQLLRATLTVKELGSGQLGCNNNLAVPKCSTANTLTDDDFTYAGNRSVTELALSASNTASISFDPVFANSLHTEIKNGFTLHVGGAALSSGIVSASGLSLAYSTATTDLSWVVGSEVHVLLETSATMPEAPTGLITTARDTKVTLAWTQGDDNDSALIRHEYCQKTSAGQTCADADWTTIANSGVGGTNAASYTVTNLTNGTEYFFRIRAVNALGPGDATSEENETPTTAPVPTLPMGHSEVLKTSLTVGDLGGGLMGCSNDNTGNECSTKLSDDSFGYDGNRDITDLQVNQNGDVTLTVTPALSPELQTEIESDFTLQLGDESLDFSEASFSSGSTRIQWTGTDVSWTDGDTIHVLLDSDATTPDAPTNLTTKPGDTEVILGWTKGADNGSALTKHQLCQKSNNTDVCAETDWIDIPMSGAGGNNEESYTVTSLTNGTEVFFYVRAMNAIGPSDAVGPESETPVAIPNVAFSFGKDTKGHHVDKVSWYPILEGYVAIITLDLSAEPAREVSVPLVWTTPTGRDGAAAADYQTLVVTEAQFADCAGKTLPATCGTATTGGLTSVTFGATETRKYLYVTAVDDTTDEGFEAVQVALGANPPDKLTSGTPASAEIVILDNDGAGVGVSPAAIFVSEGGTAASYEVVLTTAPSSDVTITVGGGGSEVTMNPSTLTFTTSNWDTVQTVSVTAIDDADAEGEEPVILTHAVSGYGSIVTQAADVCVWIRDNDGLVVADATAYEGTDTALEFVVTLTRPSGVTGTVTVDYHTEDGMARAGEDYTATSGTLSFTGSDTSKTVSVPIIDDTVDDSGQSMTLVLSNAMGGVGIGNARGTGTIYNSETPTVVETKVNTRATGSPTISGTLQVGEMLKAATESIGDADGLDHVSFEYQWFRSGTDITGATASTYQLVDADEGQTIAVRVSFTDDNNNAESLTSAATEAVAGRPVPLTASFSSVPTEHDGTNEFTFALTFSEEPKVKFSVLRDGALSTTGGTVTKARRQQSGSNLAWTIHIQPSGNGNVTVTLSTSVACGTTGSICTSDGRRLSNAPTATIVGPPGLSVADAQANEGAGVSLAFAVTLDRAPSGTVTVEYATADDSAQAGQDYSSTNGTLTFAIGETSKTVSVTLLDDDVDEGEETFKLQLSNPSGAYIADDEATGTIVNSDPVPKAWLVRFGRATTDHVLDAITARFEDSGVGSRADIGGVFQLGGTGTYDYQADRSFAAGDGSHGFEMHGDGSIMETTSFGRAPWLSDGAYSFIAGPPHTARTGIPDDGLSGLTGDQWITSGDGYSHDGFGNTSGTEQRLVLRDLLLRSSFRTSIEDGDHRYRLNTWGRAAASRFDGETDAVGVNGDVATYLLGADAQLGHWLAGVSLAHSLGAGSFQGSHGIGELETTLTALHPYVRFETGERLSAWGVTGFGVGQLRLSTSADDRWQTDTTMHMGAAGVRSILMRSNGGFEVAAQADARLTDITSNGVRGTHGNLAATAGQSNRVRLMLEGSRPFAFGANHLFTPRLEVGVRRDGGDAETGAGVEVGGTLRYAHTATALSVETAVRTLLAHEDAAYREWGASATVRLDPGSAGRGLSLSLSPSWGADSMGGSERLWSLRDARELASRYTRHTGMRLTADVGYGLPAFGDRGSMTPYIGMQSSAMSRDWRTGVRWQLDRRLALGFEVKQRPTTKGISNAIQLEGTWRFGGQPSNARYSVQAPIEKDVTPES